MNHLYGLYTLCFLGLARTPGATRARLECLRAKGVALQDLTPA
jgi:hypothetical protein